MKRLKGIQLNPSDVWKDFNCPKYITLECPKTDKLPKEIYDFNKQPKININYALQKLQELISDPVTSNSVPRICRLLHKYLHEVGNDGYNVRDLPFVIKILEFLACNIKSVKEYQPHLDQMLKLCALPPVMEKSSEKVTNSNIMEQYFTMLGHLLIILPTKEQVLKIHEALHSLLLWTKFTNIAAVNPEYCYKVMEKSELPIIVIQLLENSLPDVYEKILELVFLLSSVSHTCSHRMLEAGVLNTIFARLDLPYATQLRCTRPPDMLLSGNEYSEDTTFLIMDTLWLLLKSILPPNGVPITLKTSLISMHCALWGLRYAFQRQMCYSQYRSNNIKIRNDIAVIILAILIAFPSWNFVSSGIPDDIIKFLIAIESGSVRVFSEKVTFDKTNEDLFFQKTLLLIVTHLAEIDACIFVIIFSILMVKRKLMRTILQLVNPHIENSNIAWSASQFWSLWTYAINVLSVLVPKMPNEFIKYDGTIR
ncbi:cilia- and flagella-associated protein 69 [Calliopsis andreniformis]|uniref:cilia- and flagella-associated protein 69 n=1 Tax=Calliopsis andreniformis TaxID=337506 RepID=UPI003FCDAE5C